MVDDRIDKLSRRFKTHAVGRKPSATRQRERYSFYLDGELVSLLDRTFKDLNHQLYPDSITKSVFLETLIEYGLEHVAELKEIIQDGQQASGETENS